MGHPLPAGLGGRKKKQVPPLRCGMTRGRFLGAAMLRGLLGGRWLRGRVGWSRPGGSSPP